ncbi:MAG: type II 3-dehydroquinate dehydratase [Clostridia bacterium]|nr:type II 3-dehydroquinate dehydratase [Clostridia bacterium]
MSKKILILQGPNLNKIIDYDRGIYGKESAESINSQIQHYAKNLGFETEIFQSNCEGRLIDKLHSLSGEVSGAIINAGALSHYSYALRDAIACAKYPCIEVHMSNVFSREEFRSKSVIACACMGYISGFGKLSYMLALNALKEWL